MHLVCGQEDRAADVLTAVHEIHEPYMRLVPCLEAFKALVARVAGGPGRFPWPSLRAFGDPAGHQNRPEATHTAWQIVRDRLEPWVRAMGKPFRMMVGRAQYPVPTRVETFNFALFDPGGRVHYVIHPGNCPRLREDLARLKADEQGLVDKADEKLSHSAEAEANRVCRLRPVRRLVVTPGAVLSAGGRR
jgi:hypothetical protein